MSERIQRKREKGWRMPPGAVNVTRGSDWGNPFKVGEYVMAETSIGPVMIMITRELAVALFAAWAMERGFAEQIRRELAGKDLACWCARGQACHADWLLMVANEGDRDA